MEPNSPASRTLFPPRPRRAAWPASSSMPDAGTDAELGAVEARGKVVLTDGLASPQKAAAATRAGVRAFVCISGRTVARDDCQPRLGLANAGFTRLTAQNSGGFRRLREWRKAKGTDRRW